MGTFSRVMRWQRMLKMPTLNTACGIFVAVALASSVSAQVNNGPPIPPDQVLRQQATSPPPPPPPLPGPPPISAPFAGNGPVANPPTGANAGGGAARDRVADCQHEAAVERVPRRKRGAFIHNCSIGN